MNLEVIDGGEHALDEDGHLWVRLAERWERADEDASVQATEADDK